MTDASGGGGGGYSPDPALLEALASLVLEGRALSETFQRIGDPSQPKWTDELHRVTRESWRFAEAAFERRRTGEFVANVTQFTTNAAQILARAPRGSAVDLSNLAMALERFAIQRRAFSDRLGVRFVGPEDPAYEAVDRKLVEREEALRSMEGPRKLAAARVDETSWAASWV